MRGSETSVLSRLLHAAGSATFHLEARLAEVDLSGARLAALSALHESGESMPLSQLADRLSCVKSNITQLVDRLEADGLVRRLSDPADRRTRLAVLTAAGRVACQKGLRIKAEAEKQLVSQLGPEETRQLTALMAKLAPASE
jgi:DNA-binding MarR family transcriptional regulator